MKGIYKVVQQGNAETVPSQRTADGKMEVCSIVLQEMGSPYEDQYVATMFGQQAQKRFSPGDLVAAALRFTTHEVNGHMHQDAKVSMIYPVYVSPFNQYGI